MLLMRNLLLPDFCNFDPLSGALIAAIMQEAGLRAVRKNRYVILQSDLEEAYASQVKSSSDVDKFEFYK